MEFIQIIENDILEYNKILELKDSKEARKCVKQIEFVYGKRVNGLNGLYRNATWDGEADWIDLLRNSIKIITFFKEDYEIKYTHDMNVGVNRLKGSAQQLISIKNLSEQITTIKNELEGTVGDEEFIQISSRLNELEAIYGSGETMGKKWIKTKDILEWSTSKGVDVFIKIIPIIYMILTDDAS